MSSYQELNNEYKKLYNKDFPSSTLSKWGKEGKILRTSLGNNKYDYDLQSFLNVITSDRYKNKLRGRKANPSEFIGKKSGFLLIKGIVPKEEYKTPYQGTLMYCDCLNCGAQNIQVRFAYLSGNGNYQNESCGCFKVIRHFLASTKILDKNDQNDLKWLSQFFIDWSKFSFIHQSIIRTSGIKTEDWKSKDEYKKYYEHFWTDKQFNILYNNWLTKKRNNTFYDWWRPSLDHIIPKSRGGTNELNNLQFLTYYENHNKLDMTWDEWVQFKRETNTTSELYLEAIMKGGDAIE